MKKGLPRQLRFLGAALLTLSNPAVADQENMLKAVSLCLEPVASYENWRAGFHSMGWRAPNAEELMPMVRNITIAAHARAGLRSGHWELVHFYFQQTVSSYSNNPKLDILAHDNISGVALQLWEGQSQSPTDNPTFHCTIVSTDQFSWTESITPVSEVRSDEHSSIRFAKMNNDAAMFIQDLNVPEINEFLSTNITAVQAVYTSKTVELPEV